MRSYRSRLLLVIVLLVAVFASAAEKITDLRPTVLLVSIDGFRYDYLDKVDTPNLHSIIARGTRAKWMIPSFPTKTFPNHYTIVTGLYPSHHGIVANNMWDPDLKDTFTMAKGSNDSRWWGGEPIWETAEKQGVHAAPLLWPGSQAKHEGVASESQMPWREGISIEERVAKVANVLDQPVSTRPQFITLYFDMVDTAGHFYGPLSPKCVEAIKQADDAVGQLLKVLRDRGIEDQVNVIVVSDHGMSPLSAKKVVLLDKYLDRNNDIVVDGSPVLALRPRDGNVQALFERARKIPHGKAYLATNVPDRWHYKDNRRIQPVIVMADDQWTFQFSDRLQKHPVEGGNHGFDNDTKNMRAIFIAAGPAFQKATIKPFPNVDVYSLLAYLLNLQPAKNDGVLDPFKSVLLERSQTNPSRKLLAPWQKEWDEVALAHP